MIPFLVLWPKTRWFAYGGLVGFHLFTEWLFPLGAFPWIMIASASLLLSPSWPRRWRRSSPNRSPKLASPRIFGLGQAWQGLRPGPRLGLVLGVGLFVLVPLRSQFIGSDIHWAEEGYRFSWRVMTMEKSGSLEFVVTDEKDRILASVAPESLLTPLQAAMARTQPDMVAQAAQEIARRELRVRGHPVRVRARARVCLNGRPSQWLVDPQIDLSRVNPQWGRTLWISSRKKTIDR